MKRIARAIGYWIIGLVVWPFFVVTYLCVMATFGLYRVGRFATKDFASGFYKDKSANTLAAMNADTADLMEASRDES